MKREYDFSKGVRGKFFRKGAVLLLPIYLDPKVQEEIQSIACKKGLEIGTVVNELVKKEIELFQVLAGPTKG